MLQLRLKSERDLSQGRGLTKRTGTAGVKAPWEGEQCVEGDRGRLGTGVQR